MSRFVSRKQATRLPRLPLAGSLDLTYRCNNRCRHCWLRLAPDSAERERELTFDEIRGIVDAARGMGCRRWAISGGEPMVRPDFADVFAYISERAVSYTLNTNGTLITPRIARLMKKRGSKLIALYGATADVHDRITQNPGSFEALTTGVAYLREERAGFTVQVIPMRSNHHQLEAMIRLAESWSPSWRIGASWLHLSAEGDPVRNHEIREERLRPREVVELDPFVGWAEGLDEEERSSCLRPSHEALYASCIEARRDFHVDPYGGMSFCALVKDPALRSDLRRTTFQAAWDERIPAMVNKIEPGERSAADCGSCELRQYCFWCPVFAYLEHRDHSAKVDYLCAVAREEKARRDRWTATHRRYFGIGGLTVRVDSDLPISDSTFQPKFEAFRLPGSDGKVIAIRHHFSLPDVEGADLGKEVYRRAPWAIFRKGASWIYLGIYPDPEDRRVHRVIVFDDEHTRARIFNPSPDLYLGGHLDSLMILSSDQILLARVLPFFGGAFVHAAGVDLNGRGLLFAGPSEAGKSTIVKMIRGRAGILCDDRMIVRKERAGFRIHGTWSHGEVPEVSPGSAPLAALFFLRQSTENRLVRVSDPQAVLKELLPRFVRPLVSADWWDRILFLAEAIAEEVPCYEMHFDKSGEIVDVLEDLAT
jgi:radical SAM protein with 4Fe4S-binding SPASM domain